MVIVLLALLLFVIGFLAQRFYDLRAECDYLTARLELRTAQELRERNQRLIYERALGLPMYEPHRTTELWARAHNGDQLAEDILTESLAVETDQISELNA